MNYLTAVKFNRLPYQQKISYIQSKFNIKTQAEAKLVIKSVQRRVFQVIGAYHKTIQLIKYRGNPRLNTIR